MVSKEKLGQAAAVRKPGYVEEVFRVAKGHTETHLWVAEEDYYRIREEYGRPGDLPSKSRSIKGEGPGSELKRMLSSWGINASPNCKCNTMARKMDEWGPDETLKHIEEVIDVMEETAKKRKLPFLRIGGAALVRIACHRARKKANRLKGGKNG